ncbi:MAG: HlyD family efflux transporter periplasmic adaptor subunit [Bacteroidota bacterium]|nr:HlyD family efflux transporter periplasmic adaptor subunit [Bacteroidota bacterium]
MDRIIEKKKWPAKRILTIAGIVALASLIVAAFYFTSGKSKLNQERERLSIVEVKKGPYKDNIPVNGVVLPLTSIYLDATEGGRVEEKFVEDGAIMKKGQPILRLSNTNLMMNMMAQQNTVYNTLTQMQINQNAAQQNTVNKRTALADAENLYNEAERVYLLNKKLYAEKAIGLQELKQSENNYNYYREKKALTQQILSQDSVSRSTQNAQDSRSYRGSQEALSIMQQKVADLIVRAPVDGQLTSLDAEIGENKTQGQRLGQVDVLSGFKVRANIDEHYLSRIFPGQTGEFSFANKTYKLKIKKVFTQVVNNTFQVDMEFVNEVPQGIRRGQTLQIVLSLSDETEAVLLAKGGFYQQTGGNWIFKLSEDGKTATRVDIQLGRQSIDNFEVLGGLKPGDKVIISSYENFGNVQELVIKN